MALTAAPQSVHPGPNDLGAKAPKKRSTRNVFIDVVAGPGGDDSTTGTGTGTGDETSSSTGG